MNNTKLIAGSLIQYPEQLLYGLWTSVLTSRWMVAVPMVKKQLILRWVLEQYACVLTNLLCSNPSYVQSFVLPRTVTLES